MALRPQNTHDGGIMERRLRPIYDWLDNGNNKKALQEAEKVLKKSPSLQAARALKALALLRLGKNSEAHSVLDTLAEEKPSDDTTLQAMTVSYRESQQLPKVCALYEAAVKAEPLSEELHSHLFMSYVRIGDYRAQQRTAMALYKFAPMNPYYFWAVMSIVLQAKSSEDQTKKGILLTLAQRMVDNFITENKMEAEQEARLYIMILELQEKWADILQFMESPLYTKLMPGTMPQAAMPYLKKLGKWKQLNLLCKDLLLQNQDRWDFYMPYFDSVFELMKEKPDDSENADDTVEKCHEFICQLVESMGTGKVMRGPYLARLELWKRLAENGYPTDPLGCGVALCVQYLRVFANKPCAVPDLRQYLEMIPQEKREKHSEDFLKCLGFDENSAPETLEEIQSHVSCVCAWRLTARAWSGAQLVAGAHRFRAHYLRAAVARPRTHTDFWAADAYGILAAHHYFYSGMEQNNSKPIIEALCLLELILHKSPGNYHAKLLLVKLYHLLGNALAADAIYQRLEVKHIQLVSLGWLHATRLWPAGAYSRALQLLSDTANFHAMQQKDSLEHITFAYKYGTFDKVVDLSRWRERVCACAGAAHTRAQRALLDYNGTAADTKESHTDNRDLDIIVNYDPPQLKDKHLRERTMEQDVAFLRLQETLVSCISLSHQLADNRPFEEKTSQYNELQKCIKRFCDDMDTCKQKYGKREEIRIHTPFPSRIIAFVNSPVPYRELYSSAFTLLSEVSCGAGRPPPAVSGALGLLGAALGELGRALHLGDCDWGLRAALEELTNYIEYIGVITQVLGLCHDLLSHSPKKAKKKAAQTADDVKTTQLLTQLILTVQKSIETLEKIFENWPHYTTYSTLEEALEKLNLLNNYQCPIENRLRNGRNEMVNDIIALLKRKSKFLKGLLN